MYEGLPLGAIDFSEFWNVILFPLRILLACGAAFMAWLLLSPLFRGLYRITFQKPIPGTLLGVLRFAGSVGVGLLVFVFVPIGGVGPGGGNGQDGRPGVASTDKGKKDDKKKDGEEVGTAKPEEKVRIEMIRSDDYKPGSYRYYLIEGKEPPKTLDEVKEYLKENKDRLKVMDIIIYKDSVSEKSEAVTELYNLRESAEFPKLRAYKPKSFWDRKKLEKG